MPSLERRRLRAYLILMLSDILAMGTGFLIAGGLYLGSVSHPIVLMQAQLLLPLYLTIAFYHEVYSIRSLTDWSFSVRRLALALVVASALLTFIAFYGKFATSFSRVTLTLGVFLSFVGMAVARRLVASVLRQVWGARLLNLLVINAGGPEVNLPGALHVSAKEHKLSPDGTDPYARNRLGRYLLNQDRVIVSAPLVRREAWAAALKSAGVNGEIVSRSAHEVGAVGITRYDEQALTGLVVSRGPLRYRDRIVKRAFDTSLAVLALATLLPLMILVALAIKASDGGPVLFAQSRVGRGNRFFMLYKFRTMRVDREDREGRRSASRDDDRVTRLGRFLRRTSIDELPQLFNVLRGEMSIVGPRPHALGSQAGNKLFWEVDGRYWHRHSLKPGLTGLAQVRGLRGATEREEDLHRRLQADLEYISRWSLWSDLAIVARTLGVLVHRQAF